MRRLLLTILILCAAAAAQAQRYRLPAFEGEPYIDTSTIIDTTAVTIEGSSQGLALWGRYAFSLHDKGQCVVLDLKRRRFISTFRLEGNDSHCNNASFGVERYSRRSKFPLLYVSECRGDRACYVTDISTKAHASSRPSYTPTTTVRGRWIGVSTAARESSTDTVP